MVSGRAYMNMFLIHPANLCLLIPTSFSILGVGHRAEGMMGNCSKEAKGRNYFASGKERRKEED